jgi:alpha-L-fucosidase 2
VPNKLAGSTQLKTAKNDNSNPFFQPEKIAQPVISQNAKLNQPVLADSFLYDFATSPGKEYTFTNKK